MLKLEDFKAAKERVDEVIDETRLIHAMLFQMNVEMTFI